MMLLHEVGDDEGGTLNKDHDTLDIPAAQWTRILPLKRLSSTILKNL